jgi:hypothetical protein
MLVRGLVGAVARAHAASVRSTGARRARSDSKQQTQLRCNASVLSLLSALETTLVGC